MQGRYLRDEHTSQSGQGQPCGGSGGVENDEVVSGEGAVIESDGGAGGDGRARGFDGEFVGVIEDEADGVDFGVGDGHGFLVPEDAVQDRFVLEHGVAAGVIDLGEEIAGHGGFGDAFPAVAPAHFGLDERAEHGEAGLFEAVFGFFLVPGLAIKCPPDGIAHWMLDMLGC